MRISAALVLLLVGCGSGGDDPPCRGAASPAPAEAALVSVGDESFSYGDFHGLLAGDCPFLPRGSVTIAGRQPGSNFPLTLCVRRELDVVNGVPISLADDTFIEVVDVSARDEAGCTYARDIGVPPTGTVVFDGFCTSAGTVYNLTLAGSVGGVRSCPGGDAGPPTSDVVTLALAGSVRVLMDAAP